MTDARILQLTAEMIAADPSLRHREGEVRELIGHLASLSDRALIEPRFRDALLRRLQAKMLLDRARPQSVWQRIPRLYWGMGVIAVLVLMIATNVSRPGESPAPVAFDTVLEEESTRTSGASDDAPMLMAARSKEAGSVLTMELTSPAFDSESPIPDDYTCKGDDARPALEFTGIPEGARSLAIIVDDPDAPSGTLTHWVVYNIPPSAGALASTEFPEDATQGTTSFGTSVWRGLCPPTGTHRYVFTLYALDTIFSSDASVTADRLREMMVGHILSEAALVGTYQ